MIASIDSLLPLTINHLLKQEGWARTRLLPHAGKNARFEIGPLIARIMVEADGLVGPAAADQTPAVTIHIQAADLPLVLQHRDRAFSYVKIDGDAEFASVISQLSQSLRWEFGDDLGRVVGDVAANRILETGAALMAAARATQRTVTQNVAEYLLDEQPMLVRPQGVAELNADVVRLRDDVERLAKRIGRLS